MIKQVIVMRKDLGMRKGKMIAQGAHASMKVFFDRAEWRSISEIEPYCQMWMPLTFSMYEWCRGIFTKICVSVDSEDRLHEVYKQAQDAGLPCALIQDAGKTEFKEPTYTCCAIGPARDTEVDVITGELPLL